MERFSLLLLKPQRRVWLSFMLLFGAVACSSRGCATCVGYVPEVGLSSLEDVTVSIEQELQGESYGPVMGSLSISSDPNETCKAMPAATKLSWNGASAQPTRNGGGQNVWCSRGDAYTRCSAVEATWPTDVLLGATASPPGGGDRFEVDDGSTKLAVTIAVGRPRVEVLSAESKEIVIVFDGLEGGVTITSVSAEPRPNKSTEGATPLSIINVTGSRARIRFAPKQPTARAWQLIVHAKLTPAATCTPSKKTCKARVEYALLLPFQVP